MRINEQDFTKALDEEIELWFKNYRTLMPKVESNALAGLPADASSISRLAVIKDVAGIIKDGLGDEVRFSKFVGSVKWSLPMFVLSTATTLYEDDYKNREARANYQAKQIYTDYYLAYVQHLSDMERNIRTTDFYSDVSSQCLKYLQERIDFPSPVKDEIYITFARNFLKNVGVVEGDVKLIYEAMMKGFGRTLKNVKMLFEASYHHPGPSLLKSPLSMHSSIMYSETGAAYPSKYKQTSQTDIMFLHDMEEKSNGKWDFLETTIRTEEDVKRTQNKALIDAADLQCQKVDYTVTMTSPFGGLGGFGGFGGFGGGGSIHKKSVVWARTLVGRANKPRVNRNSGAGRIPISKMHEAARETIAFAKKTMSVDISLNMTP